MSYDEYADEQAYQEQMAAYANEVEAQLEDEYRAEQAEQLANMTEEKYVVGERVRYIGTEFDATHGGQVGTVMQADGLAGLKWVQFDDDTIAPQGWFPAKDFESYVPTKFVEDPNMPVGGGVFYHEEVFEQFSNIGKGSYQLGKEMTDEMVGDVTERMREQFGANEPATERDGILTCSCGSERWTTDVVIEHGSVTEHGTLRCAKCSRGREGTFEIRRSDIERYGLGDSDG